MQIDWDKFEQLQRRHNTLEGDVDYTSGELDIAKLNLRNATASVIRALESNGFRGRNAAAEFIAKLDANPDEVAAQYADYSIGPVLMQYVALRRAHSRAQTAHAKAIAAMAQNSPAFFAVRDWVRTQQQRGLV